MKIAEFVDALQKQINSVRHKEGHINAESQNSYSIQDESTDAKVQVAIHKTFSEINFPEAKRGWLYLMTFRININVEPTDVKVIEAVKANFKDDTLFDKIILNNENISSALGGFFFVEPKE